MPDIITSSHFGKLTIGNEYNRGGQGIIWKTNDPRILLKHCVPALMSDDTGEQEKLRAHMEKAYLIFCAVNKGNQLELRCLPREYLIYRGNPAYLMQKAQGEVLQTLLRANTISADKNLSLAYAIARAIHKLHAAQIVHADVNPENFIVEQTTTGFTVFVLDIDGGGRVSPPGPVYPMSQPKRIYKAPELAAMGWRELHERCLFFAPDDWALAVLLYQLLVDYQGPFCSVKTHPDPEVKDYRPFPPYAYRDTAASWPLPWQEALLNCTGLPAAVVSLFYQTFQHRFELEKRPRPTAEHWEKTLSLAVSPPPVKNVYALRAPSLPVKRPQLPIPIIVNASASNRPGRPPVVVHRSLPRLVKHALCASLWAVTCLGTAGLCQ